jgi:predicted nucleic acid-binding protein
MAPTLFDTSIYIAALRQGNDSILGTRSEKLGSALWLSAVVLEELLTGADAKGRKVLAKFEHDFTKAGRILVPQASDWTQAGNVLARIGERFGYERIGKSRLTNDALIATSASRKGITVLTLNRRDFHRIGTFCSLQYQILQS